MTLRNRTLAQRLAASGGIMMRGAPGVKSKVLREVGKVRLELIPAAAKREEAKALDHGNRKDGRTPWNWRIARVSLRDQVGGLQRHVDAFMDGEDLDPASLAHHLGHARARAGIILDALAHGTLIDDRVIGRKPKKRGR